MEISLCAIFASKTLPDFLLSCLPNSIPPSIQLFSHLALKVPLCAFASLRQKRSASRFSPLRGLCGLRARNHLPSLAQNSFLSSCFFNRIQTPVQPPSPSFGSLCLR